jgi:hypothetical protein
MSHWCQPGPKIFSTRVSRDHPLVTELLDLTHMKRNKIDTGNSKKQHPRQNKIVVFSKC